MKQPIVEYLFDYILKNVCHGNKSEFARKMDIRRQDVNRLDQRIHEGATSARAMESMLNLLMKENLSIAPFFCLSFKRDCHLKGQIRELLLEFQHILSSPKICSHRRT